MPNCENCNLEHPGTYGSGRFCNSKCARGFATKAKRAEINQCTSQTLTGRSHPHEGQQPSLETRIRIGKGVVKTTTLRFLERVEIWYSSSENLYPKWIPSLRNFLYRALRLKRGDGCEKCGWNVVHPTTGLIPLQIHHVNGDQSNNCSTNVQLLCPNCHSLTPNFGALNAKKLWLGEQVSNLQPLGSEPSAPPIVLPPKNV